jgi:hypothetical protein
MHQRAVMLSGLLMLPAPLRHRAIDIGFPASTAMTVAQGVTVEFHAGAFFVGFGDVFRLAFFGPHGEIVHLGVGHGLADLLSGCELRAMLGGLK